MRIRKVMAVALAGALALTTIATGTTSEAAKKTKLKTKKVSIFVKGKKKISITGKKAKHKYTFTSKKKKIALLFPGVFYRDGSLSGFYSGDHTFLGYFGNFFLFGCKGVFVLCLFTRDGNFLLSFDEDRNFLCLQLRLFGSFTRSACRKRR